jgi:DNA gyrase subunit A
MPRPNAILELRLQRLTGLEQDKIVGEYKDVMAEDPRSARHPGASPERITEIIVAELTAIREQFGDERRSEIILQTHELSLEDLITPQDMVVTLSHGGYIKAQPLADYRAQRRGGRGKQAAAIKDEDFVDHLFMANTHDYILCFSNRGRCYWLKVYEAPQGSRDQPRQADRQSLPAGRGRTYQCGAAGQGIRPTTSTSSWRPATGTVKKTPLSDLLQPAQGRHHCRRSARRRLPDWRRVDHRPAATSCWCPTPARPSGSTKKTSVRWAVVLVGCVV